jgi:hypothetical protein
VSPAGAELEWGRARRERIRAAPGVLYAPGAGGAPVAARSRADQTSLRHSSPSPRPGNRDRPALLEAGVDKYSPITCRACRGTAREGTEERGPAPPPATPGRCASAAGRSCCERPRARSGGYCSTSRHAPPAALVARPPDRATARPPRPSPVPPERKGTELSPLPAARVLLSRHEGHAPHPPFRVQSSECQSY